MADDDTSEMLVKETVLRGFLTGDHDCGLLHPEMPLPSSLRLDEDEYEAARERWYSSEMRNARVYLDDLMPDDIESGERYEFHVHVEAHPVAETDDE